MSGTKRISALTEHASTDLADEDLFVVVDMSQSSVADKTKKIKASSILGSANTDAKVSFKTVALLVADTTRLGYSGARYNVAEGDIISAEGFRYEVAAFGASDHHLATAGGVKLYVRPSASGRYPALAFGDNAAALKKAWQTAGTAGVHLCGATWELDAQTSTSEDVHLYGPGTVKHSDSGTTRAITKTGGTFKARNVTFDGNRANQSGRYAMLYFSGGDIDIQHCAFTGTVQDGFYCTGTLGAIIIERNTFRDMAEHGGTTGQLSRAGAVVGTSAKYARIAFNDVRHGTPATAGSNPGGFIVSMTSGCPGEFIYNYFENIGQYTGSNFMGCLDLYAAAHKWTVIGNRAVNSYYVPFKLQIADNVVVTANRVEGLANSSAAGGITIIQNVRSYAGVLKNAIVSANFVDCGAGIDLAAFIINGVDAYHSKNLILSENIVPRCGIFVQLDRVAYAELNGNIVEAALNSGGVLQIQNSDQGAGAPTRSVVKINGGALPSASSGAAIFARTNVTNLCLSVRGVSFTGAGASTLVTCRNATEFSFVGNEFATGSVTQVDVQNVDFLELDGNRGPNGTLAVGGTNDRMRYGTNPCWEFVGTATYDPPSVASGAVTTTTVTVTGVTTGGYDVEVKFSQRLQGMIMTAWVSASNTVTVQLFNPTGSAIDLASGTLSVRGMLRLALAA